MNPRTPKRKPWRFRYNLYRLQHHLAITSKEARALLVLLSFLFLGIIVTEIQKRTPAFSLDVYAETDSLFLQATAELQKRATGRAADSSAIAVERDTTNSRLADSLVAFFKPTFPININTATASELEHLPRIGPKMARRIIEFRNTHGPFRNPKDLLGVKGIGEKTLEQLVDKVTVGT